MSGVGYEVTLVVQEGIAGDYEAWLHHHVAQMLALPGFVGPEVHEYKDDMFVYLYMPKRDEAADA